MRRKVDLVVLAMVDAIRVLNGRLSSACTIQRWNGKRIGARPSWSMPAVEMTTRKTVCGETFRTSPVAFALSPDAAREAGGALAPRCQVRLKRPGSAVPGQI